MSDYKAQLSKEDATFKKKAQQTDYISRQAAIDVVRKYNFDFPQYMERFVTELRDAIKADLKHDIEALPSAQPEPQWIPCSERLPNGQTEVIVSCVDDSGDTKFRYTASGWVTTDGEYWIVDNEINPFVVAWMPLPEPYAERRTDG